MGDVIDFDAHRLKRTKDPNLIVASCMYCGDEFPWGRRHDHRCMEGSHRRHPSN